MFRKFYFLDEEESIGNPDETFITVPNIPLITAINSLKVSLEHQYYQYFSICFV
jgi:hypothetical protein